MLSPDTFLQSYIQSAALKVFPDLPLQLQLRRPSQSRPWDFSHISPNNQPCLLSLSATHMGILRRNPQDMATACKGASPSERIPSPEPSLSEHTAMLPCIPLGGASQGPLCHALVLTPLAALNSDCPCGQVRCLLISESKPHKILTQNLLSTSKNHSGSVEV